MVCHMQACLSEGMRVYPPVPTPTREAERHMELGGYCMHNNPAYWKVSI